MALVSLRQLLDHAAENNYGIPAFNVNNLEQVQAIMQAADEVNAPVIMQASAGARKYAGEVFLEHLIKAAIESYPHIPVCMHQDHGQSPAVCQGAINLGFSSVMMDGSLMSDGKTISTFDYNVDVTKEVVNMAHRVGVSVEGELGCLGSLETMKGDKEDGHGTDAEMTRDQLLTDPDQAAQFVEETQVDALAIAIGTSHGAYKFTAAQCTRNEKGELVPPPLRFDILDEVVKRLPGFPIVLHGSSSVPQEFVKMVNENGGKMPDAVGIPEEQLRQAARGAVCKINIDSDLRLAMTGTIRKFFNDHPDKFAPREYLKPARAAIKELVKHKLVYVLGCDGKA